MTSRRGAVSAVLTAGVVVVAGLPAQARPSCLGKRATIYEPSARWLRGTNGDDVIVGAAANWSIDALKGDDVVCQAEATQVEVVHGGPGRDRIVGTHHLSTVDGGPGDDVLSSAEPASLHGGPGDDVLRGGQAQSGGPGDDEMVDQRGRPWETYFHGGAGSDLVDSSNGIGSVSFAGAPRGVHVWLEKSRVRGWGRDTLVDVESVTGTRHADVLVGTDDVYVTGDDVRSNDIEGLGGNDVISGRGGPDWLEAGEGADVVRGGDGDDVLRTAGTDPVDAPGDRLSGGPGDDDISGGEGPDTLRGGSGDDELAGRSGHNWLEGGPGDDRLSFGGHIERLNGGEGVDTVAFTVFGPVHADLRDQTARLGNFVLHMHGVESLWGSFNGDTLIGDDGPNLLFDGGNYNADGQEDVLAAGGGDDVVAVRGDNSDSATGESFRADGGDGEDTLTFFASFDGAVADLAGGTAATGNTPGVVAGFEQLVGSREDDSLTGNDQANLLAGLGGDDVLHGRGGDDSLDGGEGDDDADGGDGTDACAAERQLSCEATPSAEAGMSRLIRALARLFLR